MKKSNQEENLWGLKGLKKVKTQLQNAHKINKCEGTCWEQLLRLEWVKHCWHWLLPLWTQQIPQLSNLFLTPKGYKAAQQLVC